MPTFAMERRPRIALIAFLLLAGVLVAGSQQPAGAGGLGGPTGSIWVGGTSTGSCNLDPGSGSFNMGCRIQIHGLADGETTTVQVWVDATKTTMISEDTYTSSSGAIEVGGGGYDPGTYLVLMFPLATYETLVPTYTLELDLVNDTAGGFVALGTGPALNPYPYDEWNGIPTLVPCGREAPVDGTGYWMTDYKIDEHIGGEQPPGCGRTYDLRPGDWFQLANNGVATAPPGFDFQMAVQAPWFPDVVRISTHAENISQLAIEMITLGCDSAGNYCPDDDVSRAQMGSFLGRTLDSLMMSVPLGDVSGFDDVPDGNVHAANIAKIAAAGITLGCNADGTLYCPDDGVTRAQMATFLARMLALDPVAENRFTDVVTGSTHAANINAVAVAGITLGCDSTGLVFCPNDIVTRAQMASFIIRALNTT